MSESDPVAEGHMLLGKGEYAAAEQMFVSVQAAANTEDQRRQALHMQAITLRVAKRYEEADMVFEKLLAQVGDDPVLLKRAERDFGMSVLEQAVRDDSVPTYRRAAALLRSSRDELLVLDEMFEAALSDGFVGRMYFELRRIDEAVETLLRVHHQLIGQDPVAALNNLIWLARSSPKYRWRFVWVAQRLVVATGHTRRRKEYLVLLLGGDRLYRKLSA